MRLKKRSALPQLSSIFGSERSMPVSATPEATNSATSVSAAAIRSGETRRFGVRSCAGDPAPSRLPVAEAVGAARLTA